MVTILESKKEDKVIVQVLFIKKFLGIVDGIYGNRVVVDDCMDRV